MLNPKYRYVGLDFETTGLDTQKDEPIQIGIAEIDHQGNLIKKYSSYIKPQKDHKELKNIVGFITGLSLQDLEEAPTAAEVAEKIQDFFGPNTILIGHNIAFDINFLKHFNIPQTHCDSIDTFQRAQILIHFSPSYALEVLTEHLNKFPLTDKKISLIDENEKENFHDAMYDTLQSLELFLKQIDYLNTLKQEYPVLEYFLQHPNCPIHKYLNTHTNTKKPHFTETLKQEKPKTKERILQLNKTPIILEKFEDKKRYHLQNTNIQDTLRALTEHKNIILSFSHPQKADIAKHLYQDLGLKNLGNLYYEQIIDEQKYLNFLNKQNFRKGEIAFIIKYYSQFHKKINLLDLNTKEDHQIFQCIKKTSETKPQEIIICTHHQLYNLIQQQPERLNNYTTLFFDSEWRYKNYNNFIGGNYESWHTTNLIEGLIYKYELENEINNSGSQAKQKLQELASTFDIFTGELGIESKQLFINTQLDTIQVNPITNNHIFEKSMILRQKIQNERKNIQNELHEEDTFLIQTHRDKLTNIWNNIMTIQRKIYNENLSFVYSESTAFTSREEFKDIFSNKTIFLSTTNTEYPKFLETQNNTTTFEIMKKEDIITTLTNNTQTIFILSTQKDASKELFDLAYQKNLHKNTTLIIENLTGGTGKNLFKAKKSGAKIIIGGYTFLLSMYAQKISIDRLLVFHIKGKSEQLLLDDIVRYANK